MNLKIIGNNYTWQVAKAAAAFLTVVVYSRVLGAHFRGELSLMLLYLQLALMINEMVVGSVMANWFVRFDFKFLTQRLWWVSGTVLGVFGLLGWLGFNWGYMVLIVEWRSQLGWRVASLVPLPNFPIDGGDRIDGQSKAPKDRAVSFVNARFGDFLE